MHGIKIPTSSSGPSEPAVAVTPEMEETIAKHLKRTFEEKQMRMKQNGR